MRLVVNLDCYIKLGLGKIQSFLEDGKENGLAEYARDFVLFNALGGGSSAVLHSLPCAGRMEGGTGAQSFLPACGGEGIREGSEWDSGASLMPFWVEYSKSGRGAVGEAWLKIGKSRYPYPACMMVRPALEKAVAKRAGEILAEHARNCPGEME